MSDLAEELGGVFLLLDGIVGLCMKDHEKEAGSKSERIVYWASSEQVNFRCGQFDASFRSETFGNDAWTVNGGIQITQNFFIYKDDYLQFGLLIQELQV